MAVVPALPVVVTPYVSVVRSVVGAALSTVVALSPYVRNMLTLVLLAGCATNAPLALEPTASSGTSSLPVGPDISPTPGPAGTGNLVVYTATFVPTLEEGEYPEHTDYTVATVRDKVVRHVTNRTGSFDKRPATVTLIAGEYHVRAQWTSNDFAGERGPTRARGGLVIIPVIVGAGTTITIHLDGSPMPLGVALAPEPIRLPDGGVVGWRTLASR